MIYLYVYLFGIVLFLLLSPFLPLEEDNKHPPIIAMFYFALAWPALALLSTMFVYTFWYNVTVKASHKEPRGYWDWLE